MCKESAVPAAPESSSNADESLIEVDGVGFQSEENAVPAVPVEQIQGEALIAMAAEKMRRSLVKQGIIVPAFSAD